MTSTIRPSRGGFPMFRLAGKFENRPLGPMVLSIISKKVLSILLLICSALLCLGSQSAWGNQQPCGPEEAQALLPVGNPAYADAVDLVRTLSSRGFVVKCILSSKMEGLFAGQEGAALYRTNRGDFETLFLPKSQNFNALQVVERRETGGYVYSFRGSPPPWPAPSELLVELRNVLAPTP